MQLCTKQEREALLLSHVLQVQNDHSSGSKNLFSDYKSVCLYVLLTSRLTSFHIHFALTHRFPINTVHFTFLNLEKN